MEIIWSDDARQDYEENIEYLLNEWSGKSASTFIEEVESVLELLKINPKLYPKIDYKSIKSGNTKANHTFLSGKKLFNISDSILEHLLRPSILEAVGHRTSPPHRLQGCF